MKESDWRYLVDALLYVCLAALAAIGALMGFVIPEGPVSAGGTKHFLGLHRHQWGDIHAWLSLVFVVVLVVHLILSWKGIAAKARQVFKQAATPALIAVGLLPFLLLFVLWAVNPKDAEKYRSYGLGAGEGRRAERLQALGTAPRLEDPTGQSAVGAGEQPAAETAGPEHIEHKEHRESGRSPLWTGRHTLRDIENATGLPAAMIISRMGLPPETSADETLGRLRRLYGFMIEDVRDVVDRLLREKETVRH